MAGHSPGVAGCLDLPLVQWEPASHWHRLRRPGPVPVHPKFREQQEDAKHAHVLEVAASLPEMRAHVAEDLNGSGLTRERVLACAVRLTELGFFRVRQRGVQAGQRDVRIDHPAQGAHRLPQRRGVPHVPGEVLENADARVRRPTRVWALRSLLRLRAEAGTGTGRPGTEVVRNRVTEHLRTVGGRSSAVPCRWAIDLNVRFGRALDRKVVLHGAIRIHDDDRTGGAARPGR